MLGNEHFYNRTIRKIVVAFGTMFDDIQLTRYSKDGLTTFETTKVPLSYGAKEKYLTRITADPNLTKSIATTVPRMSFDLNGMSYDNSRKQQSTLQNFASNTHTKFNTQYAPIPYNFDFSLSIYVRNTEDGTQILEQILPYFTPDFTVTLDYISTLGRKYDMPVILNSVTPEIEYEGDMSSTRIIIWNLTFTAKAYIFPPVNTAGLIEQANTNIFTDTRSTLSQKVYVDYANGSGVLVTGEVFRDTANTKSGTIVYFANNSSGILVVSDLNELLEENDVIVGDYSNATYTIDTVDMNPLRTVAIITVPDPITANASSIVSIGA